MPFFVAAICYLVYPGQHWLKDWTVVFAGASLQAQLVFIWCSLKWRTDPDHLVPNTPIARNIFWTVNLGLVFVPHLFAMYCHREELGQFVSKQAIPFLKNFHGDVKTSHETTKKFSIDSPRNGPVTRQQKKNM